MKLFGITGGEVLQNVTRKMVRLGLDYYHEHGSKMFLRNINHLQI
jgi:hypothetical protein